MAFQIRLKFVIAKTLKMMHSEGRLKCTPPVQYIYNMDTENEPHTRWDYINYISFHLKKLNSN